MRDRLLDPFTLAGEPRPVTLPRYDWQVYHPRRPEKGGVRWHTVEGPFVLARKGLLYQTFSGGNWQSSSYGVGYATSRAVDDPGEWSQAVDGVRTLPVLRSGGEVVGPGHNSVVRGPDGRQLYCVYHRWSAAANARPGIRTMAIDRLDWAGERLLVLGPTTTPQPAPALPAITVEGEIELAGAASPAWPVPPSFLCEVTARVVGDSGTGGWGFALHGDGGPLASLLARHDRVDAPAAFHLLRLEVDGARAMLEIEGIEVWRGRLTAPVTALSLVAEDAAAAFSGFALTPGWEELFVASGDPSALGWEVAAGEAVIRDARLWLTPADPAGAPAQISRGPAFARYELVVNARQEGEGHYAIFPALSPEGDDAKPVITLAVREGGWALGVEDAAGRREVPLPQGFEPAVDQQLRFRRAGGRIEIFWEGVALGEAAAAAGPARVGLGTFDGTASFEAVRVTAES